MQPHSSSRDSDAWAAPGAEKKSSRAKKSAKKKAAAKKKSSAKKTAAKKKSATKNASGSAPPDTSLAELLARLDKHAAARPLVAALRRELGDLEHKVSALEHKLAELEPLRHSIQRIEHRLGELSTQSADPTSVLDEVVDDPYLRWLGDPSIERYIGQHVALHAARGVIAHADSVAAVIASVRAQGLSLDDVCLATVPAVPF